VDETAELVADDEPLGGFSLELNATERRMLASAQAGHVVRPLDDAPPPDPAEEHGWDGRAVRASLIAALVTDEELGAHPRGLRLEGAPRGRRAGSDVA
jgi:hypothetical protein